MAAFRGSALVRSVESAGVPGSRHAIGNEPGRLAARSTPAPHRRTSLLIGSAFRLALNRLTGIAAPRFSV
ncbi:MAG: hypothetical protein EA381_10725 [Planctomycetaceae bacterium]|nr:MAG: hypothetical protein EA381_10725 [Planctomycetaceae bacterium]